MTGLQILAGLAQTAAVIGTVVLALVTVLFVALGVNATTD